MTSTTGRPKFRATRERREAVEVLRAAGFTADEIAVAIGCSPKTLRQHFAAELAHGAVKANARVARAVHRAAVDGSPAAQRLWRHEVACLATMPRQRKRATAKKPRPDAHLRGPDGRMLGKKERALIAAADAGRGTEWEGLLDPLPPTKPN